MAREPDMALLMTGKLHKKTHLLVFLIIIWGVYGSYGSLSQKGSRPLLSESRETHVCLKRVSCVTTRV